MRSSLLVAGLVAVFAAAGCATTGTGEGQRTCHPILSWASPAYGCEASAPPPAEPEPEPVAEPEPKEEPEPEPEPERVTVKEEKIELSETVQFESGSAKLLPESEKLLAEVAQAMKDHPEIVRIRVEGHTDSRAGTRYNRKLSRARAKAVRKFLIGEGIRGSRLVVRAYGEKEPVDSNKTPEGRYKNRRVEFKILKRK
jgi:OmpA-OmpF porin, OOP family